MRRLLPTLWFMFICLGGLACGGAGAPLPTGRGVTEVVEAWESGGELPVDAQRGLLVLRYCASSAEAQAGGAPACEPSSYRHCGESLRRAMTVLREDLEMRQNYSERRRVYECAGSECRQSPMMDGDYEGVLRFDTNEDGPVLIEVRHLEGRPTTNAAVRHWAEQERAAHRADRCAAESV